MGVAAQARSYPVHVTHVLRDGSSGPVPARRRGGGWTQEVVAVQTLPIRWQRLMKDGVTCTRCAGTEAEVRRATATLSAVLAPLGIEPVLDTDSIDEGAFAAGPLESNRIWVADRAVEDWLGGAVGSSPCCSVCGEAECRTLQIQGTTYETVPEAVIVRAGLVAAAQLLGRTGLPAGAGGPAAG
jgi:Domain of unknown function (DUF2703)